jgi:hypothetical protein
MLPVLCKFSLIIARHPSVRTLRLSARECGAMLMRRSCAHANRLGNVDLGSAGGSALICGLDETRGALQKLS